MGRPTSLTDELRETILQYARAGIPQKVIAEATGIATPTLSKWLKWGDDEWVPGEATIASGDVPPDREPYRTFRESFRAAQARPVMICEATMLKAVQGTPAVPGDEKRGIAAQPAIPPDAKVAEKWLKLHRPDLYREQVDVEIVGPMAKAVEEWGESIRAMIEQAKSNGES